MAATSQISGLASSWPSLTPRRLRPRPTCAGGPRSSRAVKRGGWRSRSVGASQVSQVWLSDVVGFPRGSDPCASVGPALRLCPGLA
eukprot:2156597-Pyramimonas_sp.AAC.1